jgi:hypothetical protein
MYSCEFLPPTTGHYIATVRHNQSGRWYTLNDGHPAVPAPAYNRAEQSGAAMVSE